MTEYFWESSSYSGSVFAQTDKEAVDLVKTRGVKNVLIVYKKNDLEDGKPFVIIWENK